MADRAFDPGWLALREPADHRSRDAALLVPLRAAWRGRRWRRVLDLGCGTGSNLRYLAPRLPGAQEWTLLDRDEALLARIRPPDPAPAMVVAAGDLADEGLGAVGSADLVAASALLDLVSREWLAGLVETCRAASAGAYFALTIDGGIRWHPGADADDELVRATVNAHQGRDKGLGPALGSAAAPVAERLFREAGYWTSLAASPWRLGPDDAALARGVIEGWAHAAEEARPDEGGRIRGWAARRQAAAGAAGFQLTVGHLDLLALPAPPTAS